jgi:hypothetical protein
MKHVCWNNIQKLLLLVFLSFPSFVYSQNIVINEVMASNVTTILDENGDASDWIELFNKGSESINLSGYHMSDDSLNKLKWQFDSTVIAPGGYLLIFASDKNRHTPQLHTNFKISKSGEPILLSDTIGVIIDQINLPVSGDDISYGRKSNGTLPWMFQHPTPGSSNTGKGVDELADSVIFSIPGGFYSAQIEVGLSANGKRIFYTLDGSNQDSTDAEYATPITIQKTTVLRAFSVKKNYLPGRVITNTYFINVATDLPVISLTTDSSNLFDYNYGIYADGPGYTQEIPHFGANYWMDWERPAHIEFFEDNKSPGFSEDCGIAIYGAWSRANPQKSFAVKFKDEYGAKKIEYPLFPDFYVTTFKSFVLRNSGNDFYYTHIRDAMMQTLVKDLDIDYLEYRPATTFINGVYWGIYNIREKINEHYIANRHGIDPDNIDLLEANMSPILGDSLHYQQLINYISTQDMSTTAAYDYVNTMIDLNECILYFAAQAYYDNRDWPCGNIKYWRERSENGKWRWILYDLDFGFGLYEHGQWEDHIAFMFATNGPSYPNPPWATLLQRKLVANRKIKNQFINQIADLLNTNFKSERVVNVINRLANHIASEIIKHRARWKISGENLDKMTAFANERPAYLRNHVRNYFGCGSDGNITINSTEGGTVKLNTLTIRKNDVPWTGIYFQGNAIHLRAIPAPGYKFDGWTGDVTSQNYNESLLVSSNTNINASFSVDTSSAGNIVINEINYNSSDSFNSGDWIELYNRSGQSVDISGWIFRDSDSTHAYIFPAGTILESDQYLVLTEDSILFSSCFPDVKNFVGNMDFGLNGSGEFIKLMNAVGQGVDSLTYDDQAPWPTEADGQGATLELVDPASDNSLGENWRASIGHGTPGEINSTRTSVDEILKGTIPDKHLLSQNYPNPFNPSTTFSFSIPKKSIVSLKVFDILGRCVVTIVSEELSAGNYKRVWNSNGLSSGIYFYRLQTESWIGIKKLILLK